MNNYFKAVAAIAMVAALSACAARRAGSMSQMFSTADTNGDGIITREEFVSARTAMFDRADTNHDGQLTQDEVAELRGGFRARR